LRRRLPRIFLGPEIISDLDRAIRLEWIVTNGLGGYASSTVLGINTRKFHGLLFVAFDPPVSRHLFLSKMDEEILVDGGSYPLGSNMFKDAVYPEGHRNLKGFSLQPFPTFHYEANGIHVREEVFMPHLRSMVIIKYEVLNSLDSGAVMNVYPLVNMRHFYEVTSRGDTRFFQKKINGGVLIESKPKKGCLGLFSTEGTYQSKGAVWIEQLYFRTDDLRGESHLDDNYQPGFFKINLPPGEMKTFQIVAAGGRNKEQVMSLASQAAEKRQIEELYSAEVKRLRGLLGRFYQGKAKAEEEDWLSWLVLAADSFIVSRDSAKGRSVIAGYHWFGDWGRDSLISLPGLTLVTGRFGDAERILLNFARYCKEGLVPSRFPDSGGDEPAYDSVDSSLWFFNAVLHYLKYTGNFDFVYEKLWSPLQKIIEGYIHGTRLNIRMDDDGLILHGPRLTWMDASVGGSPVTPREGKAVEIQALWYNALKLMESLSKRLGEKGQAEEYRLLAETAKKSFNEKFWYREGGYLYDVVDEDGGDSSLRPNQIIAASLDFCILDHPRRKKVIELVWRRLWATYGLRSLSPDDPGYIGRYIGDFPHRDSAYHNGTAWAWLTGPFVTAFLKARDHGAYWRRFAFERFLQPLFHEETRRAGLGTISEILDGDPPHLPRGCISQAWSVAEPLRAYVEDVLLQRPPYERKVFGL
jgi:predicted glycogen debranching enzyme